jgi:hypothetical protein
LRESRAAVIAVDVTDPDAAGTVSVGTEAVGTDAAGTEAVDVFSVMWVLSRGNRGREGRARNRCGGERRTMMVYSTDIRNPWLGWAALGAPPTGVADDAPSLRLW